MKSFGKTLKTISAYMYRKYWLICFLFFYFKKIVLLNTEYWFSNTVCFHLSCFGNINDDISPEDHFENSKTNRGSYVYLELFIFVQLFEFFLVTQSL